MAKLVHLFYLKAKAEASKADNPNLKQAMNGSFADEFWKAAVNAKILDIIWAFKIKQFPDGLIKGFKGRICARGD